ncbi:MAG: hypothetical protein V3R54_00495 [Thermodesulfovibrionia bacterium]
MIYMEYQQRIIKGSRLITQKIKEIARETNIEITRIEWYGNTKIIDEEELNTLKVFAESHAVQEKFYAKEIVDFHYDSGDTIKKIRNMVRILKSSILDNDVDKSIFQ